MAQLIPIVIGHRGYWGSKLLQKVTNSPHYSAPLGYDIKDFHNGAGPEHSDATVAIIATPTETHFDIAKKFLTRGKHVLLEKPATQSIEEMEALLMMAKKSKLGIDHTFLFDEHIRVLKQTVFNGTPELGQVSAIRIQRYNLGKFNNHGVIWDLIPHDLAVLDYLFDGQLPRVESVISQGTEGTVHTSDILLTYTGYESVNISLSWLYPKKVRQMTVVCEEGMASYDMMSSTPLVLTDKKAWPVDAEWHHNYMWDRIYKGPTQEPLQRVVDEFAMWINGEKDFISPGEQGARVIKTIETILDQEEILAYGPVQ